MRCRTRDGRRSLHLSSVRTSGTTVLTVTEKEEPSPVRATCSGRHRDLPVKVCTSHCIDEFDKEGLPSSLRKGIKH